MNHVKTISILGLSFVLSQLAGPATGQEKRPNLGFSASSALINAIVQRSVDRTEAVHEIIQDTPNSGTSRTIGTVRAELIPDPHVAVVDVAFAGHVWARSVGTRGTILIRSTSTTAFDVRNRVVIGDRGICLYKGTCRAETDIQLLGVTSRMDMDAAAIWLNERFFYRARPAAQAETAGKASAKIADRMVDELSPSLASASNTVRTGIAGIKKAGLSLESMRFRTSESILEARLRIATPGKPEPSMMPNLPGDIDLGVRVHESLLNQIADATLAGKSFRLDQTDQFYNATTKGFLRDGRTDADRTENLKKLQKLLAELGGQPAIIRLAKNDPLEVHFTDQGFTVELRIASIQQGKTAYEGMRVRASYRLENSPEGVHAVRTGAVQFLPYPSAKKLAPQTAAFIVAREVLFTEIAKERVTLALPMPEAIANLTLSAPRGGSGDGWLGIGWTLKPTRYNKPSSAR